MSKHAYIDRALIKLQREYSKDELVAALVKKIRQKDVELGKLKAEIDHLEATIANSEAGRVAKQQVRQLKEHNKRLKKDLSFWMNKSLLNKE